MKYSVIIPIYNAATFLNECIDSIIDQRYMDFEVILIDDGSTDNSFQICQEYAQRDKRVRLFHQENEGVSSARNRGLKEAKGTWVTFVDADDYIMPRTFELFDEILLRQSNCDFYIWSEEGIRDEFLIENNFCKEDLLLALFKCAESSNKFADIPNFAGIWNKVYSRSFLIENGCIFDSDLVMGEDMMYIANLIEHCERIAFLRGGFYCYRNHLESVSRGFNAKIPARDYIFQEKLKKFILNNGYTSALRKISLRCALGGILVSGNAYFFRYSLLHIRRYRTEFYAFLNQPIYINALNNIDEVKYCLNIKQYFILRQLEKGRLRSIFLFSKLRYLLK